MRLFVAVAVLIGAQAAWAQQTLSDPEIARMVHAGVAQDIILKMIADAPVVFRLDPERLEALKTAGVPDEVVQAMMAHDSHVPWVHYVPFSTEVRTASGKKKGLGHLKFW